MNDQIPNTDEKKAVERWENEGGMCLTVMKPGSTAHGVHHQNKRKGWVNEAPKQNKDTETTS